MHPPEGTEMSLSVGADAFCADCSDVTCVVLGWSIPVHASCVLALAGRNLKQKPKNSSHEFDTMEQAAVHVKGFASSLVPQCSVMFIPVVVSLCCFTIRPLNGVLQWCRRHRLAPRKAPCPVAISSSMRILPTFMKLCT